MTLRTILMLASLLLAAACGGGGATTEDTTEPDPVADTSGDDDGMDEEPVEAAVAPRPASGPGQIHVVNVVRGEEVGGTVQVIDESGSVVAEGSAGGIFNVDSGTYTVRGTITEDSVMIDTPTFHSDELVEVPAGGTGEARVVFPVARVRFAVTQRGRAVARWTLRVTRQGRDAGEPIQLSPSQDHVAITPGRYDAVLNTGGNEVAVSGLIFQGGATQTVPVAVD